MSEYKVSYKPAKGGWAPGNYISPCVLCKDDFASDKRSHICADCAYKEVEYKDCPTCTRPTARDFCTPDCRMQDSDARIEGVEAERDKFRKALEEIAPMCGNPDAVDACRLILNKCQEVLEDE